MEASSGGRRMSGDRPWLTSGEHRRGKDQFLSTVSTISTISSAPSQAQAHRNGKMGSKTHEMEKGQKTAERNDYGGRVDSFDDIPCLLGHFDGGLFL